MASSIPTLPELDPLEPLLGISSDELAAQCRADLEASREAVAQFKRLPAAASFLDVVDEYDAIGHAVDRSAHLAHLFFQAHPDSVMRDVGAVAEQELSRFSTELSLDREVYDRLVALDLDAAPDPVSRRIVEHALRDYRRAGVDRDEATRRRITALREELVEIGQSFSRNIASDVRSITIPEGAAGLEGLPADFVAAHAPDADGAVTVTTNPTDYMPFAKYARNREHREALLRAYLTRGTPDNLEVLDRLLSRRHELATLLGYPHWAAYVTEDKMIKTAEKASSFVQRVTELSEERMRIEYAELLEEVQREVPDATEVRDWDRSYFLEKLRQRKTNFDTREARPYFAYAKVRDGVLDTAARLYGVEFVAADVTPWHPDVEVYDVLESGERIARFFLDMHPREDKFKHAAMFDLTTGLEGRRIAQACLVCNFPQPSAAGGDPGLLEPDQVTTYFHEFGHLMHHLLAGRQRWMSVSGIATEWDFVEVPSQLFEEWGRDPDVLARFATHWETGEPIPAELVARMNAAADYGKGLQVRVQMFYATLSLSYYDRDPASFDSTELMRDVRARVGPYPHEEGTFLQASFGHLDGYSAAYYTYMWSLVLAKDVFSRFEGKLMDPDVARRYRETILAPGGSKDAADLVADFLGRPFAFDAFEAWLSK